MAADQSTIITSLCWVSRGFANQVVEEYEPNPEELREFKQLTKDKKGGDIKELTTEIEKNLANMDLDKYDEEDNELVFTSELKMLKGEKVDEEMEDGIEEGSSEDVSDFEGEEEVKKTGVKGGKSKRDNYPDVLEDSEEEKEDYTIRKSDALIVAATAEDEHSNLEVYIYDHKTSDLYVHHEIIISSYPLCLEWLHHFRGQRTNMVIVGTFLPEIEIWDLNKEDCEPLYTLGGISEEQSKKKKKKSLKLSKPDVPENSETSHTDAVMSLSLNPFQSEYLASGSADCTVKIWDLDELQCKANITNLHKNKVQLVRWSPHNEQLLLTGGYDRVVNVCDIRERPLGANALKYRLKKEVKDLESGQWHPFSEHNFVITTESGVVIGYDIRNPDAPVFEFKAHEKACSSVSFSPHIPNMMATCSTDEYIKIWDIAANNGVEPKLIGNKKTKMGELFTLSYYKDIPWVIAAGGSKGELAVWDTEENESIQKHFTPFIDPTKFHQQPIDQDSDEEIKSGDEDSSDDEGIAKKKKSNKPQGGQKSQKKKQIQQLNKISEGIQKIREMKKKGGK